MYTYTKTNRGENTQKQPHPTVGKHINGEEHIFAMLLILLFF